MAPTLIFIALKDMTENPVTGNDVICLLFYKVCSKGDYKRKLRRNAYNQSSNWFILIHILKMFKWTYFHVTYWKSGMFRKPNATLYTLDPTLE